MAAASLDTTGLTRPPTWVETKVALERFAPGDVLGAGCRPGEALGDVPACAREPAHEVALVGDTIRIVRR